MKRNALTYLLLPFLLALLVTACKDDTLPVSPAEEEEAGSGVYVSVVVNTGGSNASRVPTPGEDGDLPKEPGTGDENMVHDLNVFFFQTSDGKGLNTSDNAEEIELIQVYFSNLTPSPSGAITYYATPTQEVEGLYINETYEVLTVVNAGEKFNSTNLADLRTHVVTDAIETDIDNHLRFLMASAGPKVSNITIIANNSRYNPSIVSVDVERLAARVDYKMQSEYSIGETGDKVVIQSATLVNKHETHPYVFKRVTNGTNVSDIPVYLGDETVVNDIASNYVLDPQTVNMTDRIYLLQYENILNTNPEPWLTVTADETYHALDYTQENVVTAEYVVSNMSRYCTGVVFKAQYTPVGMSAGTSFYWYAGEAYQDLKAVKKVMGNNIDLNENNYPTYGVRYYENGICYYTYWIKHADDGNPDVISPMEYAIVRNNIYQLQINSISKIGGNTPQDEVDLNIRIYVCAWEDIMTSDIEWK